MIRVPEYAAHDEKIVSQTRADGVPEDLRRRG
jgi:hypothetical protein